MVYLMWVATIQHKKTTEVSLSKIGISQNTKCDNLVSFPISGRIYYCNISQYHSSMLVCMSKFLSMVTAHSVLVCMTEYLSEFTE